MSINWQNHVRIVTVDGPRWPYYRHWIRYYVRQTWLALCAIGCWAYVIVQMWRAFQ